VPRDEEDDFEDRPRRRRDEDDDDERPRRRRRRDDEDEDFDGYDRERRGKRRLSRELLRAIAANQKVIIFCILIYLCLIPVQFVVPENLRIFIALAYLPVAITATVFVFLLATKVYSTGTGVLLAILTFIPCIGLIMLLIINGKATGILQAHGIHVGLLGARSSDI